MHKKEFQDPNSLLMQKNSNTQTGKGKIFDEQLNKIIQNAKVVVKDSKNGSFSIKMHPESLGKVNVNLNLEQGTIIGKLLVETHEAREAMIENLYHVKAKLQENGISVGEFQVNVRDESKSFKKQEHDGELTYFPHMEEMQSVAYETEARPINFHDGSINIII